MIDFLGVSDVICRVTAGKMALSGRFSNADRWELLCRLCEYPVNWTAIEVQLWLRGFRDRSDSLVFNRDEGGAAKYKRKRLNASTATTKHTPRSATDSMRTRDD